MVKTFHCAMYSTEKPMKNSFSANVLSPSALTSKQLKKQGNQKDLCGLTNLTLHNKIRVKMFLGYNSPWLCSK